MNKKFKIKISSILLLLLLILTFVSCSKTDKETVLSSNVSEDIQAEETEVKLALEKGHNYLSENDFENAKLTYEKAISMDKLNKDIYLEIKDKYVELSRFDDALYFIQLAINNNSDSENMKAIANDIKFNLATPIFSKDLYEGDSFTLPTELTTKINNEDITIPVTWNNSIVDTSTTGTFSFIGTNKEYNREFNATINVLPPVLDEEYAFVKNIYTSNGKTYVDVDLVEFLRGDNALSAAIEDNANVININDDGVKFINNGYYIRDKSHSITTYEVNENSIFSLTEYRDIATVENNFAGDRLKQVPVSYNKLESYIESNTTEFNDHLISNTNPRSVLFLIKFKNNIVYDISFVFTP